MKYDRANDPNAGRLIESLRYLGYGNYEAIADLVDNSIDAEAHHINIRVQQRDNQPQIWIADDGSGMDQNVLDQAMRLGSLTSRDLNSDLGKFGMGLVTASLSIARRCHVITMGVDGCWSSAWDVDEVIAQNKFVKHLDKATKEEQKLLEEEIGKDKSGTLIMLTKCDNLSNRNTSSFANTLKSHLGQVHRYFIDAGREITINGEKIASKDPLQLNDPQTEIVIDDLFPITLDDEHAGREENVRVRIVLVSENPASDSDIKKNMKNQGFYVMRNQREILGAETLGFFTKHNDFNRMRGEIFFTGALDRLVGIEFTKRDVNFNQSLYDQLARTLVQTCTSIRRREQAKNRVKTGPIQQQLHNQSIKSIVEKDKLLIKPKARIEKRSSPLHEPPLTRSKDGTEKERKNLTRTQVVESKFNCEIREERLGPGGQIYECQLEGKKIIIRYNVEHPFYQRFVVDNLNDARVVTAADFLIYSMASAELKLYDDGDVEAVSNFKAVLSSNLRTLLN